MIPNKEDSTPNSSPEAGKAGKIDKRNFMFINISEKELIKRPGEINGNTFKLSYLTHCTVWLLDHTANLYVDECENSKLHLGPVAGTVQLQDLEGCIVNVACKQLKCVNCKKYFSYTSIE